MSMSKWKRKILSRDIVRGESTHIFGNQLRKRKNVTYVFDLFCGHKIERKSSYGGQLSERKYLNCEWCEYGEEPQV